MGRKVIDFYWIPFYLQAGKFALFVYYSAASSNLFAHSKHRIIAQEASEGIWYNGQFLAISKNSLKPKEGGKIIQRMKHTKSTVIFCLFKECEGFLDHLSCPDFLFAPVSTTGLGLVMFLFPV